MVTVNVSRIIFMLIAFEVVALLLLVARMKQSASGGDERPVYSLLSSNPVDQPGCLNRSEVSSDVNSEDGERYLYANEDLDVEAIAKSINCIKTFLQKYADYCEKALVPGPQYQNNYLSLNNNRRITSLCPCISPYLRKYIDILY